LKVIVRGKDLDPRGTVFLMPGCWVVEMLGLEGLEAETDTAWEKGRFE